MPPTTTTARTKTAQPTAASLPTDGATRVVIEGVRPCVDHGRFPVKRVVGEKVVVTADVFADGHDLCAGVLRYRHVDEPDWSEQPLAALVNDRWEATFVVGRLGFYEYTIEAWIDRFGSWRRDLAKRHEARQVLDIDLETGALLVEEAAERARGGDRRELTAAAAALRGKAAVKERVAKGLDQRVADLVARHAPRPSPVCLERPIRVRVDRQRARFSAWYEMFPRSASPEPGRHGTFADVEARLPYVAGMGFDVLYLPPVHPIGVTCRKGPNNALEPGPDDVGSPWAIGGAEGGHKAVHPRLGTLEDFERLAAAAREHGLEIALDIAFQCSPDHPYLREHPEWFRQRPDGSIQYAENPPKKYEDIYPFDFECAAWEALWEELKSVFLFWIERGVTIFRVDNPHTKSFGFWEWLIDQVQRKHPEVIFLAEAFTRPKIMYRLAKLGFTQSYTYFTWRNQSWELQQYFTELTATDVVEFFRPNVWPNTPDILTEFMQHGGRAASVIRLVLAATLSASYGIYGPPFELVQVRAREPGSEEYLDSEKYELRTWDLEHPDSLRALIMRVNRIRRENAALQQDRTLRFHGADNQALLCYSKVSDDGQNAIVCVVNTNPHGVEAGTVALDLEALGLDADHPFQVHDLLTDARFVWQGSHNYCVLDPGTLPAHVLRVRRHVRSEQDFEYYV
jgi:starch synthase (maltosyl-transferring)